VNIKEYISSGIVEAYVMGLASAEEAEEFERMCATHTEVRNARDLFEQQIERNAIAVGVQPPKKLKSLILSEIEIDAQKNPPVKTISEPAKAERAPVFQMTPAFWKYAAAASIILLLGSTFLNFYFFNQYRKTNDLYTELLAGNDRLATSMRVTQTKMDNYAMALDMSNDSNVAVVKMLGVKDHPGDRATVFWNKESKDVYLMVNNLPQPPTGKQYQLWAIVNGQPVDAGMVNWEAGNMKVPIKNVPAAQAFAITLEQEGGSQTPTPNAMHVLGNT
jgi:anti-sigma-K factor RskA